MAEMLITVICSGLIILFINTVSVNDWKGNTINFNKEHKKYMDHSYKQLCRYKSFTDEFHDICDLVIYGRSMKVIRHEIQNKWNDP